MRECGLSTQPTCSQTPGRGTGYRYACRSCGKQVRGRHPDVAPDQYGASAHRVGRRVMRRPTCSTMEWAPVRKVPAVLRALTGVELSQGAISQDALRPGVQWGMPTISCGVRCVPVHSSTPTTRDGVDGGPAFLMKRMRLVYQVRARHRNEEVVRWSRPREGEVAASAV